MGLKEELLALASDEDALMARVDTLQLELFHCYGSRNEEKGNACLRGLSALFKDQTQTVLEIVERTSLYLCAPCLVCSILSVECRDLSADVLDVFSSCGPAKEVFTGLTDGVSRLLETSTASEMSKALTPILASLGKSVLRVTRRQERFVSISVQLVYRLAQKMRDECLSEMDGCAEDISMTPFLQFGRQLQEHDQQKLSLKLTAYMLLVASCFVSLFLSASGVSGDLFASLQKELREDLGGALSALYLPQPRFKENLRLIAQAWCHDDASGDDSSDNEASIVDELHQAGGMLMWASTWCTGIPRVFSNDMEESIVQLIEVEPSVSESPCILAALDLISALLERTPQAPASFWKPLSFRLVMHMDRHPEPIIKSMASDTIQLILKHLDEEQKWLLLKELVFVQCSDIAALMVQYLRSSVVSTWDTPNVESAFSTVAVFNIVKELLRVEHQDDELLERAELYSAVLNLYFFLLVREEKCKEPRSGVCSREGLEIMQVKISSLKDQIDCLLEQNKEETRLTRLQLVVDSLLDRIDKATHPFES